MGVALVYLVAGISSRFGGKIKQLAKIGPEGETLIEYSVNQALSAEFTKIIFIVGEKTEAPFREMFGSSYKGIPVQYALQTYDKEKRDKPWGTLDALYSAKTLIDCPFVMCSGDDLYGEEAFQILVKHLKNNSDNATVGYKLKNVLSEKGTVNRGVFEVDSANKVTSITEIFNITKSNFKEKGLTEDSLCSMLFFGFQPEIMNMFDNVLKEFQETNKENRTIEVLLPEEVGKLIKQEKINMQAYSTNYRWIGITNPEDEQIIKDVLKTK